MQKINEARRRAEHIIELWANADAKLARIRELGLSLPAVEKAVDEKDYQKYLIALCGIPTSPSDSQAICVTGGAYTELGSAVKALRSIQKSMADEGLRGF